LRQRTLQAADTSRHAIDIVAGPEFGHAVADRFDRAREIDAEDGGQGLAGVRGLTGTYLDVERVDRARRDPNQDLPRLRSRPWNGRDPECGAGSVEYRGLHGFG
jgi:hypothetical protein